ncbi:MAG: LytR C-terminal domain-containing protein [Patescibacteria group bacterium]
MGISDDIAPRKANLSKAGHQLPDFSVHTSVHSSANTISPVEPKQEIKIIEKEAESDKIDQLREDFFKSRPEIEQNKPKKQTRNDDKKSSEKTKKSFAFRLFTFLFIVALAGVLAWQYWPYKKSAESKNSNSNNATEQYKSQIVPQDYTETNVAASNANQNTNETVASNQNLNANTNVNTNAAATLQKSTIKISVLNGNGVTNSASTTKTALEAAGFKVLNTGNASNFNYQTTFIYYNTGKLEAANLVQTSLPNNTITLKESASVSGKYDVVVVVGKK